MHKRSGCSIWKNEGFILPTVVVSGVILLALLIVSLQLATSSASALREQHYLRLAKEAAEAGVAWLEGCIRSDLQPQIKQKYMPNSRSCTDPSVDGAAQQYFFQDDKIALRYEATVDSIGVNSYGVGSVGIVDLLRSSGGVRRTVKYAHRGVVSEHNMNVSQKSLISGFSTTFFIRPDGALWGWGNNEYGQIGNGTVVGQYYPVRVLDDVKKVVNANMVNPNSINYIAASAVTGNYTVFALKNDGSLWAWGLNRTTDSYAGLTEGMVGDGSRENRHSPVRIFPAGVKDIFSVKGSIFALKDDNSLWAWGSNQSGKLGIGTADGNSLVPLKIMGPSNHSVVKMTGGHMVSMAIKSDGSLWAWGNVGNPSTRSLRPKQIAIPPVKDVRGDYYDVQILLKDGRVMEWDRVGPTTVISHDATSPRYITGLASIERIYQNFHANYGIDSSGAVFAWGDGPILGDGEERMTWGAARTIPYKIISGGVKELSFHFMNHFDDAKRSIASFALKADGSLLAWGNNRQCALLKLDKNYKALTPVRIMTEVKQMHVGYDSYGSGEMFAVVRNNNDLYTWGRYTGDATSAAMHEEVRCNATKILEDVRAVYRSELGYQVIDNSFRVWTWGSDSHDSHKSPLGRGPTANGRIPGVVKIPEWRIVY